MARTHPPTAPGGRRGATWPRVRGRASAIVDRLAYLAGPVPPSPVVQRRMLHTLAGDARELAILLDALHERSARGEP